MTAGGDPRRRPQPGRGRSGYEEAQQVVRNLQTAAELLEKTAQTANATATDMSKAYRNNQDSINDLVDMLGQANPGTFGRRIGGTMTPGWAAHRAGYQGRNSSWGAQGYPGGSNYGMGFGAGHGGGGGGVPLGSSVGGLGGLQAMAARAVHQNFGTAGYTYTETGNRTDSGDREIQVTDANGREVITGSASTVNEHIRNSGRGIVSSAAGGAGGFGHGAGHALGGARSVLQGLASRAGTGGIGGAVGTGAAGALRAIPYVGAAVMAGEAVYKGAQFFGEQRQQNTAYQSIYGGSNLGATRQRFDQAGYRIGQLFSGGLSGGDADKAFKAVSSMGYGGNARQDRLNFVQNNYKSMGMGVDDSMQLLQISSTNLTSSLRDLHTELQAVSKMAKETGQNAGVLRQAFTSNFATTTAAGFGPSSGPIAQAMTAGTVGMGRTYAGMSMAGQVNSMTQLGITAAYGGFQNPAQMQFAARENPMLETQAMDKRTQAGLRAMVPQEVQTQIKAAIKARGGNEAILGSNGDKIAEQIAADVKLYNTLNPYAVQNILTQSGITVAPSDMANTPKLYGMLVSMIAKQDAGGLTADAKKAVAANAQQTGKAAAKSIAGNQQKSGSATGATADSTATTTPKKTSLAQYGTGAKAAWDPVIAKLEKDIGKDGLVQVQTGDGQEVVSLKEASEKYRDQLADGSAILVSGRDAGRRVSEVAGREVNQHYKSSSKTKDTSGYALGKKSREIMGLGLSNSELEKVVKKRKDDGEQAAVKLAHKLHDDKKKDDAKTKGEIKLYMQPDLARWIGADATGNVAVQSAAAGAPTSPNPLGSSTGN